MSCLYKGKKCLLSQSLYLFPYNVFLYFLEGQKYKHSNLGIMISVGYRRLVKVIFSNIHKISDACANSFSRYIMIAQCMRNVFPFYYIQVSLEKMVFLGNSKLILILFKTFLAPLPLKKRAETMHSM